MQKSSPIIVVKMGKLGEANNNNKSKNNNQNYFAKILDMSKINYYKNNKKSHYAIKFFELSKS